MTNVMEIARFRAADGTDAASVRAAAEGMAPWLAQQPGFVNRTLVGPGDDGVWHDLVQWRSKAEALAAAEQIMTAPGAAAFMAVIAPDSASMDHAPISVTQRA